MAGQIFTSRDKRCADPGGGVGMAQHQLDLDRRRSISHSEFIIEIVVVRNQGLKIFFSPALLRLCFICSLSDSSWLAAEAISLRFFF